MCVMTKRFINIIFISVLISFSFNMPVDLSQSLKVAKNVFIEYSGLDINEFSVDNVDIISENNLNLIYLYHLSPSGFILIPTDDRAVPYLGYSFTNNFNLNNMPSNASFVINSYKTDIINKISENRLQDVQISIEWDKYLSDEVYQTRERNVSPLIDAEFDQSGGWNNVLTSETGFNGPVGCVAVSMAQIMHYWSYPSQGEGENSYYEDDLGTLSVDFSIADYDYDSMASTWATYPSQLLLYHSGVAVNMDYENNGSGAAVEGVYPSAEYALTTFFKFSDDIDAIYLENFTQTEFRNILKEELEMNRPIIYSGFENTNYDGGHAWNIDGYQGNNLHCNWGWGGWQNGYFNLTTMGGFEAYQTALVNIIPEPYTEPIALYEYDVSDMTVTFIDLSEIINDTEINIWDWNFDDGNTQSNTSGFASHTYANAGEYDVTLNISNIYGYTSLPHTELIIIGSTIPGDINGDELTNILDIVTLVNFVLGALEPTSTEFSAADINDDNILNILDVVILVNTILNS